MSEQETQRLALERFDLLMEKTRVDCKDPWE